MKAPASISHFLCQTKTSLRSLTPAAPPRNTPGRPKPKATVKPSKKISNRSLSSNRAQRPQTACGLFFVARFGLLRLGFEIFFDGFAVAFGLGGSRVLVGGATGIGLRRLVLVCHKK